MEEIINLELNEEKTKIGVVKVKNKDDTKNYYEIVIEKSCSSFGDKNQIFVVFRDITGSYRYNKSINNIKKRELTMAKLAHELKSPISTIGLITDQIYNKINDKNDKKVSGELLLDINNSMSRFLNKEESMDMEEDDQSVAIINNLCNYLMILIEDLNAYVKINNKEFKAQISTAVPLESVNLIEIFNFCYLIFYTKQKFDPNKQNVSVTADYDKEVEKLEVKTNEVKLKQLLINLLSNAYKFTISGDITLSARDICGDNQDHFIRISVSDSGCGLTKEEQDRLFQPFSQIRKNEKLNPHGSGLGLTIVKEISNQLNYKINIKSIINVGTSFYFDVPGNIKNSPMGKLKIKPVHQKITKNFTKQIDDLFIKSKTQVTKSTAFQDSLVGEGKSTSIIT